jgi:hypothetical protein
MDEVAEDVENAISRKAAAAFEARLPSSDSESSSSASACSSGIVFIARPSVWVNNMTT